MLNMTGHTKREIVVQKLLKSVELFKSYDLLGEPKSGRFSVFWENVLDQNIFNSLPNRLLCFLL
jgi:hypothetical protein